MVVGGGVKIFHTKIIYRKIPFLGIRLCREMVDKCSRWVYEGKKKSEIARTVNKLQWLVIVLAYSISGLQ